METLLLHVLRLLQQPQAAAYSSSDQSHPRVSACTPSRPPWGAADSHEERIGTKQSDLVLRVEAVVACTYLCSHIPLMWF